MSILQNRDVRRLAPWAVLAVVQARMRHSDPKLTTNIYTKLGLGDQAAAVEALPEIDIKVG